MRHSSWALHTLQIKPDLCSFGFTEKNVASEIPSMHQMRTVYHALLWHGICAVADWQWSSLRLLKFRWKHEKLKCLLFGGVIVLPH